MNSKGGDGLNDEVGSIMNFFYRVFPVQIYDREIPIQIKTPSLYFPPPSVADGNDTVSTYMKTYSLNVKLFIRIHNRPTMKLRRLLKLYGKDAARFLLLILKERRRGNLCESIG